MADIFSMADTWNNGASTFDAIRMDVTDAASDAASRLLWLGVGGSAKLTVGKGGKLSIPAAANENAVALAQSLTGANAQSILDMAATWNTSGTPTALKVNVTDTASNAASRLLDLQVGGSSKFAVAKTGNLTFGTAGTSSAPNITNASGGIFIIGNTNGQDVRFTTNSGNWALSLTGSSLELNGGRYFAFSPDSGAGDLRLNRDAADILSLRRGTNAQTFRVNFSHTDNSNYTRLAFKTATGIHTIETESAGTGEANIDLALVPKGTGAVRFGSHSAIGAETVTGYITIKDAAGNSRKVAVVS